MINHEVSKAPEEEPNEVEEEPLKVGYEKVSLEHTDQTHVTTSSYNITELMLCRKAYLALKELNTNSELTHLLEEAHHTEHDQRHHLKVPWPQLAATRAMIHSVIRTITRNSKRGRCPYGEITKKNLTVCMSKLHG